MHIPIRTKEPAAGPATDKQGAVDHREPRVRKPPHRNFQASPVAAFLRSALAGGAVPVSELEERAGTAGLLGDHNHIGDAKRFKSAKKRLGITSRRDGFGRGGSGSGKLPAPPSTPMPVVLTNSAPNVHAGGIRRNSRFDRGAARRRGG